MQNCFVVLLSIIAIHLKHRSVRTTYFHTAHGILYILLKIIKVLRMRYYEKTRHIVIFIMLRNSLQLTFCPLHEKEVEGKSN